MPISEAQKQAQARYVAKNKERIAQYKRDHWHANKHRWSIKGGAIDGDIAKADARKQAQAKYVAANKERIAAYKSAYWQANKHKWNRGESPKDSAA